MPTVGLLALGCAKNRAEAEGMLGQLAAAGFSPISDPAAADLLVVHTCGFIAAAAAESVEAILEMAEHRRGRAGALIVSGCLAQREREALQREIPEIDAILGTGEPQRIAEVARAILAGQVADGKVVPPEEAELNLTPRVLTTPPGTAYLRLAEGCDHHCRFCLIPSLRGRYRSRPAAEILREAEGLVGQGVKELVLVAQDPTRYGGDLPEAMRLPGLLRELERLDGLQWIRLLYLHPEGITEELVDAVARGSKILPYLDIPFQHASARVLRSMGRAGSTGEFLRLIELLRERIPNLTLRSTLLVGFPGETREDFAELLYFIRTAEFDHLGAFAFSPEEGIAALADAGSVPEAERQRRQRMVLAEQRPIALRQREKWVGRTVDVLVGGHSERYLWGRSAAEAPEQDGLIYLVAGAAEPGQLVRVKILGTSDYDLLGEIVE